MKKKKKVNWLLLVNLLIQFIGLRVTKYYNYSTDKPPVYTGWGLTWLMVPLTGWFKPPRYFIFAWHWHIKKVLPPIISLNPDINLNQTENESVHEGSVN